ncbi:hypothetical protein KO507_18520, partial [Gilvimarinus agarilyticus]|nr:hypothetical protein [Gilvimarinus agarilyticus]
MIEMKKYIYILIMSCTFGALVSCVESTAPEDEYGKGYNLAGFVNGSQAVSAVADGSEYAVEVPMQVKGPAMNKTKGTVVVNIEVDESSTAIEGTHFSLSTKSIELTEGQDFLSLLPLAVMTQGVVPPATFSLVLKVSNVDGENVIANGSTINLNLVYQCPADLS